MTTLIPTSVPALLGGARMASDGFVIRWPEIDDSDIAAVSRVAQSGDWWRYNDHSETEAFERAYASYHDAQHCLAIANGTVAIEAALIAAGMRPGDEIIVPALTFIATASAVLMAGGIPVFADADPDTYQINPDDVESRITDRTTGIVIVHYAGYPCDLDRLKAITDRHGLFLIEDCAHAQGTAWKGRKVGAIGDAGTFSFQMSKSLTCGEGGAIITDRQDLFDQAYAYHHIGRSLGSPKYDYQMVGPNYRVSEFQSAILRTQLAKLQRQTETRMATAKRITDGIADIAGLRTLKADERVTQRGYYFFILRFDEQAWGFSRDLFVSALKAEGLNCGTAYGTPVYKTQAFQAPRFDRFGNAYLNTPPEGADIAFRNVRCPVAERLCASEQVAFETHMLLQASNGDLLIDALHKLWRARGELTDHARASTA